MRQHITQYFDIYLIFLMWTVLGLLNSNVAAATVTLSLFLFWRKDYTFGLLAGFIIVLVFSDSLDYFAFAKSYKNIYILFLLFVIIAQSDQFRPFEKTFQGFLPFLIVAIVGLLFAGNVQVSAMKTLSYLLLLIIVPNYMLSMYRAHGSKIWIDFAYFLIGINVMGAIFSIYSYDAGFLDERLRGLFGNPNGQGLFLYLSFAYFFIVDLIFPGEINKSDKRIIYLLMLVFFFLCGSRTAFISVFILVFFNWLSFLSPYISFLFLLVLVISLDSVFGLFVELIRNMGLEDYFRLHTLEGGSGRFVAWAFAWDKIQDYFFLGGSLGNDEYVMRQHYRELALLGHQGGVHNSYLTLWFDVGIIGLIFYFFNFVRLFFLSARNQIVALPMLYSVLFCITYESWLAGSLNPFTIILFMILTVLLNHESEDELSLAVANEKK